MNLFIGKKELQQGCSAGFCLGMILTFVAGGCSLLGDGTMEEVVTAFPIATTVLPRMTPYRTGTPTPHTHWHPLQPAARR